jgi:pyruvate dehydrogenase E2 component (dihydrolipoamide acetyltransferase)
MAEVWMAKLSDTMEEGTIVAWLVQEGATVAAGDELAEIQTDKAVAVLVADDSGVIHLIEPDGATVAVGAVIAEIT